MKDSCLWTALITPFNNGKVDYSSLENLLLEQKKAQIPLLLLGSTAEALSLTLNEKKEILNFVLSKNLNLPLMVGVGGINLKDSLAWITYLEKLPVDCYLTVTPLYSRPGTKGQLYWFESLFEESSRPCMLYNIPSRTGCSLDFETVNLLKNHTNFWAIKEAGGKIEDFLKYKEAISFSSIKLFSGDDALMPDFADCGATGLVSVASNVWPLAVKSYVKRSQEKTLSHSLEWKKIMESLFTASNPVPVKALLEIKGWISSREVRLPLSAEDLRNDDALKEADKKTISTLFRFHLFIKGHPFIHISIENNFTFGNDNDSITGLFDMFQRMTDKQDGPRIMDEIENSMRHFFLKKNIGPIEYFVQYQ